MISSKGRRNLATVCSCFAPIAINVTNRNKIQKHAVHYLSKLICNRVVYYYYCCCCGSSSSVGIATELRAGRYGDRIPVGVRFFAHVQTGPGAHPASCTMGTGSFPGVKRPGRGADHLPPSSAEVKKG
jgi:hypothetical protein